VSQPAGRTETLRTSRSATKIINQAVRSGLPDGSKLDPPGVEPAFRVNCHGVPFRDGPHVAHDVSTRDEGEPAVDAQRDADGRGLMNRRQGPHLIYAQTLSPGVLARQLASSEAEALPIFFVEHLRATLPDRTALCQQPIVSYPPFRLCSNYVRVVARYEVRLATVTTSAPPPRNSISV
jgi:hypothetical protein